MRVIPAIDLQGGKCVRLYQGDFNQTTEYSDDPVAMALKFAALDVSDLHVVDLDGARTGIPVNTNVIRSIAEAAPFEVQVGGGVRDELVARRWFDNGVKRCVVGSLAVLRPDVVKLWFKRFGADRIVLALDIFVGSDGEPLVSTHGWRSTSDTNLWECISKYQSVGLMHVLCTDIDRDGALVGPNTDLYVEIMNRHPSIRLQASGGVRNSADLSELQRLGIPAAITGRALLDGKITASEVASFRQSA